MKFIVVGEVVHSPHFEVYLVVIRSLLGGPSSGCRLSNAKRCSILLAEQARRVHVCGRDLKPDDPQDDHKQDWRQYLQRRTIRSSSPNDAILFCQRAHMATAKKLDHSYLLLKVRNFKSVGY